MEFVQPTVIKADMYDVLVEVFNVVTIACIKVSVCLLVRRIIRGTHFKIRVVLWVMIVFLSSLAFTTFMFFGFLCKPMRRMWNPEIPEACSRHLNLLKPLMRVMCGKSPW